MIFKGSGVAIVTPFKDGRVDFAKLEELVDWQIQEGTDAIVVAGTTGEASTMNDTDHLAAIKCVIDKVAKRVPVIAGTGSNDTNHGIELSQEAERLGADGLLLVTPYYNKATQKGLIMHYKAIAGSVKIPVILYNVPGRTGVNILPETALELSKVENIVAMKEASGNISQIAKLASIVPEDFAIYSGNDDQIVPILSLGGVGVISVVANICPKDTHDMVIKYLEGDVKASAKLQLDMKALIDALFIEVNPIPVKTALNLMGFGVGELKLPLCDMEPSNLEILKNELKNYGIEVK